MAAQAAVAAPDDAISASSPPKEAPPKETSPKDASLKKEEQEQDPQQEAEEEPTYGGYTRFELELEFVQALANPYYLNHLASQKLLTQPSFVAYLDYLRYWTRPPYLKYLTYPGPTLRHLELLQQEQFRKDIMSPDLVQRLVEEGMRAAVQWHRKAT